MDIHPHTHTRTRTRQQENDLKFGVRTPRLIVLWTAKQGFYTLAGECYILRQKSSISMPKEPYFDAERALFL